jgi:hypothetical protein
MGQPVLLGFESDRDILDAIQRDLTRRFASDYRIVIAETPRWRWRSSMLATRSQS